MSAREYFIVRMGADEDDFVGAKGLVERLHARRFSSRSEAWAWVETQDCGLDDKEARVIHVRVVPSKPLAELRAAALAFDAADRAHKEAERAAYLEHPELVGTTFEQRREHPGWARPLELCRAWAAADYRLDVAARAYAERRRATNEAIDAIVQAAQKRLEEDAA